MSRKSVHPATLAALREAVRDIQARPSLGLRNGNVEDGSSRPAALIGVTSPRSGEGKTTIAVALASSLAEDLGEEVTLVDADFPTHSIEHEYGLPGEHGLSDAIEGTVQIESVRHRVPGTHLSVIGAGVSAGEAEGSVRSERASRLVRGLKEKSGYVVLDLPATLHASAAPVLARLCDGVIVVVRTGHSTRQDLDLTLERLQGAEVRGIVLNGWRSAIPDIVGRALALRT